MGDLSNYCIWGESDLRYLPEYRRDAIDRSHYPGFRYMEGARMWWRRGCKDRGGIATVIMEQVESMPKHGLISRTRIPVQRERNPQHVEHTPDEVRTVGAHLNLGLEHPAAEVFGQARAATATASDAGGEGANEEPLMVRCGEMYFPFTRPS